MQKIKIGIVEDEEAQATTLISFLNRFAGERGGLSLEISSFPSSIEFAETYKPLYDILFLDIKMPGMTGMELAHEIRKSDQSVCLVFVTSLAQYAIEGYSVEAADYILKPLSYPEFKLKMVKLISALPSKSESTLIFNTSGGTYRIPLDTLIYCETDAHSVIYHTERGDFRKHQSMKEAENDLKDSGFIRINSCYLVDKNQIVGAEQRFAILKNGERLLISRPRISQIMSLIKNKKT